MQTQERYNRLAIILHWLIAILIISLIPVGLFMDDAPKVIKVTVYQMHKSFGLMVLFLSFARLGLRLLNPPPPLPDSMKTWEKAASHSVHGLFYILIIAMPLSGWMMVSSSPKSVPTQFLMLFNWPHIWFLASMAMEQKKAIVGSFHEAHELMGYGLIALLVLHVGAALKHQYIQKDNEMARMLPSLGGTTPPSRKTRGGALVIGGALLAFVLIAYFGARTSAARPALLTAPTQMSGNWQVDKQKSDLSFTFTHVRRQVTGHFKAWDAAISFDPQNLSAAHILARIDLASAKTGEATYDTPLPQADWFDVDHNRMAVFESKDVQENGPHTYNANGTLSLRGVSAPATLVFTLTIDGDTASASGGLMLDRLTFGIGKNADAKAEYVKNPVKVIVQIAATRTGNG